MEGGREYVAIDLKSFYASVECIQRGLDPMQTNLVVADESRTDKTICLAVSPALKSFGVGSRPRLFEAKQTVSQCNAMRIANAPGRAFTGASQDAAALREDPSLAVDFIIAPPQMALYMEYSAKIYGIYLKYVAPEDIHVYSVDEVFMDVTGYLKSRRTDAEGFTRMIVQDVLESTGITATAGIGTNLYLCKVAMDIVAKKKEPDRYGVRIARLDEMDYRRLLWDHKPITDFWRIGRGYARRLEKIGLHTMGDIARCSLGKPGEYYNEDLLFRVFGIQAQLLIDHAWGWEPVGMADIKAYRPTTNSISTGQVLCGPYSWEKGRLITREMTDQLTLDLVERGLVTDQLVLTVGYDIENLTDPERCRKYRGEVVTDHYGRKVPKHAHGTVNLDIPTASTDLITRSVIALYEQIVDPALLVRRINLTANHVIPEQEPQPFVQLDLFGQAQAWETEKAALERERRRQKAVLKIRNRFGKNAILKGMNFEEGATAANRNRQIGGHRA